MRMAWRNFLSAESGAAVFDWVLLAVSLSTLLAVAVGTATGGLARPDAASPNAGETTAVAPVVLPAAGQGLGS